MEIINVDESPSLVEMQKAERRLRDELQVAISNFEMKTKTRVKGLRVKRDRETGLISDVLLTGIDILA